MNYRIAKTMLVLCVIYLVGFYVLKFAFPELLLQTITSPTMLQLGKFLNSWKGYEYILTTFTLFITFYLFLSASKGSFNLSRKGLIVICAMIIIETIVCDLLPELYTHTSIVLMLALPAIFNGNFKYTVITFTVHGYLSQLLLSIRGFETIAVQMVELGLLSGLILGTEIYVWMTLLSIIFYFKEKNKNEQNCTTLCKQPCGTKES